MSTAERVRTLRGVRVIGTGSYLPARVVTNAELSRTLDTSDEWIRSRTGIAERRFAGDDEPASVMAVAAARHALAAASLEPGDLDLIVCATMTGDFLMPSLAAIVARELGAERAGGYDLNSACSGFVLALSAAMNQVRAGAVQRALVIGAEKMSVITDPTDRATAVIFADGAGAAVLAACDPEEGDLLAERRGLRGDEDVLVVPAGGSRRPHTPETLAARQQYVHMQGRETFKFAVKTFASLIQDTCADAGVSPGDVAAIVPHQVNLRILDAACQRAGIASERCTINIERVGNTSAASVAIALDEAVRTGNIRQGDLVLLLAFGAGLSWGSVLVRW